MKFILIHWKVRKPNNKIHKSVTQSTIKHQFLLSIITNVRDYIFICLSEIFRNYNSPFSSHRTYQIYSILRSISLTKNTAAFNYSSLKLAHLLRKKANCFCLTEISIYFIHIHRIPPSFLWFKDNRKAKRSRRQSSFQFSDFHDKIMQNCF